MSTMKIKTEPTTTTAVNDVQVKLEPSLSTADIKLEQHTSDIDTKAESDSEADNEEDYIKSEDDDDDEDEDDDQDQFTITPRNQQRVICGYPGCGRGFGSASFLRIHRHEHRLQATINTAGKEFILARQSLDDRWPCPVLNCTTTLKTADNARGHIRKAHNETMGQHKQQQQPQPIKTWPNLYFIGVGNFYVNGVRCGYCNTIGVFLCHECRQVPECLLTHLQQKHGYNEKSIDNSALPDSAVNASADPNINQHISNPHLAAAIRNPYQLQQHQDIFQGWLCITSDCGYCGYRTFTKDVHKSRAHRDEQLLTVPALILRLVYAKPKVSCFLVTRIDQASGAGTVSGSNRAKQHKLCYNHNRLNAQDENGDDASQNHITDTPNQKKQWKCEHPDCERFCNSADQLRVHRREHQIEAVTRIQGKAFTLRRQSSNDRWACPVPDCEMAYKTIEITRVHIRDAHSTAMKQKRVKIEDDNNQQKRQIVKGRQRIINYLNVDDFYVCGVKYGHHTTTGLFLCYECQSVPECLLTHLQQKHGYDGKSIDNAFLPESARNSGSDPNGNQYTSNSHLAAAFHEPSQQHHPDIVQGWLCIAPNCGYCYSTIKSRYKHQDTEHGGKQLSTVPALVLRLLYSKAQGLCFIITRLDTVTRNVKPDYSKGHTNNKCDDDDGDELVLSDYGDDDDVR